MKHLSLFFSITLYLSLPLLHHKVLAKDPDFIEFSTNEMEGLDSKLPETHRIALSRINEYRKAARLPLWIYDDSLSKMAQKHADYVLMNCQRGRTTGGHFEKKNFDGYTKEGDEAARTSGLSGGPDPLDGLERLMAGPYHRKQFLNPDMQRVGIGFTYDRKTNCSSTLFVSRPIAAKSRSDLLDKKTERFRIFPPNGFPDVLLTFKGENPDPRPKQGKGRYTGYPLSVCMSRNDALAFVSAKASMTNSKKKSVEIWVSDPAHPFTKSAPPGIYAPGTPDTSSYFSRNAYCVMIFPEEELQPGEQYTIDLSMKIGSENFPVSWSFQTRGMHKWKIESNPGSAQHSLKFVSTHVSTGDHVFFSKGRHSIQPGTWFPNIKKVIIEGSGKGNTVLSAKVSDNSKQMLLNFYTGNYTIRNLTFSGENSAFFYVQPDSKIMMDNVEVQNARHGTFMVSTESTMEIANSSFKDVGDEGKWSFCIRGKKDGKRAAVVRLMENNYFEQIHSAATACGAGFAYEDGRKWNISPQPDPGNRTLKLEDALRVAPEGEDFVLTPGNFSFSDRVWFLQNHSIRGSGVGKTIIQNQSSSYLFNVKEKKKVYFSNLTFSGEKGILALRPGAEGVLENVAVSGIPKDYFAVLEPASSLSISGSNFENYESSLFIYMRPSSQRSRLDIAEDVLFPQQKLRNGGEGITKGFPY